MRGRGGEDGRGKEREGDGGRKGEEGELTNYNTAEVDILEVVNYPPTQVYLYIHIHIHIHFFLFFQIVSRHGTYHYGDCCSGSCDKSSGSTTYPALSFYLLFSLFPLASPPLLISFSPFPLLNPSLISLSSKTNILSKGLILTLIYPNRSTSMPLNGTPHTQSGKSLPSFLFPLSTFPPLSLPYLTY